MKAFLNAIEYYVPEHVLTNEELAREFPEWTAKRIEQKLGIVERHIVADDECASDLGVKAAQKLLTSGVIRPQEVDYLLFCTQAPDYFLPSSACVMQDRLGIPCSVGALDINLGCSGYVYGLSLAKGLIETDQASNVLLITADTYSKFLHPKDKGVRTLFGDGAAATLVQATASPADTTFIGPFVMGTDGKGAQNLIVEAGGSRKRVPSQQVTIDASGNPHTDGCLYMNGREIFAFTIEAVPRAVQALLDKARSSLDEVDLFVFHQANQYMLEFLRSKCQIPEEKFVICLRYFGNTVSSTIPIALKNAQEQGRLHPGSSVMLVGFGVGYSWGATLIRWAR